MKNAALMCIALLLILMGCVVLGITLGFAVVGIWEAVNALTWVLGVLVGAGVVCALNIREK